MSWEVALKIGGRFEGAMMAVLVLSRAIPTDGDQCFEGRKLRGSYVSSVGCSLDGIVCVGLVLDIPKICR